MLNLHNERGQENSLTAALTTMNTFVVLLGLCGVMIVHKHKAHSQKFSIDEYCTYELPLMKRGDPGYLSVLKLIQVCSDLEMYTDCLKKTRASNVPSNIYKLHDFEKVFPSDDDMERAGYLFCILTLISDPYTYNVSPGKVTACHSKVNEVKCEVANERLSPMLRAAVGNKAKDTVARLGCTMYTSYWTCMRDEYAACSPEMKPMFDYYLARAGASCLKSKKTIQSGYFWHDLRRRTNHTAAGDTAISSHTAAGDTAISSHTATNYEFDVLLIEYHDVGIHHPATK